MDTVLRADQPNQLHPWVAKTEACLNRTKPDDDGLIRPKTIKRLNVAVSTTSIRRAMLIWDRILKAVEGRFKVRMEKEPPCRTTFLVDGEELSIALKEKTPRSEHVPTSDEKARMKISRFLHGVPKWDFTPSGILVLAIDSMQEGRKPRHEVQWADTEKKRIEDRLDAFADVLIDVANDIKEGRARAEEWHRQFEEECQREAEEARKQAEERRRAELLEKQTMTWEHAGSIRRFIAAVREEAVRRHGGIKPGGSLEKWILWAEARADKIDPVKSLVAGMIHETAAETPAEPTI